MNRDHLLLGAVALVSLLAGGFFFQLFNSDDQPKLHPVNAEISLKAIPLSQLDGSESILEDWADDILIINFWAPWCAPCREEIPDLIAFHQEYSTQGYKVLGIALDESKAVRDFAADFEINYPLFLADNRINMYNAAFQNPSGSLPFTIIIDKQQKILFRHNGIVSLNELRQQLGLSAP